MEFDFYIVNYSGTCVLTICFTLVFGTANSLICTSDLVYLPKYC